MYGTHSVSYAIKKQSHVPYVLFPIRKITLNTVRIKRLRKRQERSQSEILSKGRRIKRMDGFRNNKEGSHTINNRGSKSHSIGNGTGH